MESPEDYAARVRAAKESSLLAQAQAGQLPEDGVYQFTFEDDVLVQVKPSSNGTGQVVRRYTDPAKLEEARKRLQEARLDETVPEGAKLNRKARRAIHASAKRHIRQQSRKMVRAYKRALNAG